MGSVPPPNPTLARLAATLSPEDARELARLFLHEFPALRQALEQGTPKEAKLAAHSLKSSAQHMGATALADRLAELEQRLDRPGAAVSPEDLAGVDRDYASEAGQLREFAND
jgi:HPt (histidine-containing phosphotransfer) domain-containing protein